MCVFWSCLILYHKMVPSFYLFLSSEKNFTLANIKWKKIRTKGQMMLGIVVGIVGIIVTVFSIVVTVVSIRHTDKEDKKD